MAVYRSELHGPHETIALLLDCHFSTVILDLEYSAEIGDVDVSLINHEVVWLNISVDSLQLMNLLDAVYHLYGYISDSIIKILAHLMLFHDIII